MTEPTTSADARLGSGGMFDRIADRYDLVNRIISGGFDQSWRRRTVAALELPPDARVLDVAAGTGDIALRIARDHADAAVVALDPSPRMLDLARAKADAAGLSLEIVEADAQALPFDDDSFDGLTIAFGIRNVPDRVAALREFARVVRPGRRVAILELSEPQGGLMGPLARFHIHSVVPWVGSILSGAREYRYLERSIAAFPPPAEFAALLQEAGLTVLSVTPMTFGVCCLYVATAPGPT